LVGAAAGALIFGVLGQQAVAPHLEWLIAIRFVLSIGIGAD
jgi:hypothetical protein